MLCEVAVLLNVLKFRWYLEDGTYFQYNFELQATGFQFYLKRTSIFFSQVVLGFLSSYLQNLLPQPAFYLFKGNKVNTGAICEICLKLTKTLEWHQRRRCSVINVNFEHLMLNFVHCCVLSIVDFEQVNANWNKSNPSYFCTKILQIFEKFLIKIPWWVQFSVMSRAINQKLSKYWTPPCFFPGNFSKSSRSSWKPMINYFWFFNNYLIDITRTRNRRNKHRRFVFNRRFKTRIH